MKLTTIDPKTGKATTRNWRGLHPNTIANIIKKMSESGVEPDKLQFWIQKLRAQEVTGDKPWTGN